RRENELICCRLSRFFVPSLQFLRERLRQRNESGTTLRLRLAEFAPINRFLDPERVTEERTPSEREQFAGAERAEHEEPEDEPVTSREDRQHLPVFSRRQESLAGLPGRWHDQLTRRVLGQVFLFDSLLQHCTNPRACLVHD